MINIEKEFYLKIEERFGECGRVAFHLTEMGALTTTKMEQYLIRNEFQELKTIGKKPFESYRHLADKYCKEFASIRYIVERLG